MTGKEWTEFWKLMDTTFRFRKVTPEERPIYEAALATGTLEQLKTAVLEEAKHSRLLPSIAELARHLPQTAQPPRDSVQIDAELRGWYERHITECHNAGVPTAVECKKRGISVGEYMERAGRAGI